MKFQLFTFPLFAFFAAVSARAETYDYKDVVMRTGAFAATGEITIDNVNGSIDVRTWDKNEISIEAEKSAKTEEELKLIDLQMELSGSEAKLTVRLPKRSGGFFGFGNIRGKVRFKLLVPANVTLKKISAVNSSVKIDGVRGSVDASSVNGELSATHLGGAAKLQTVNGAIKAQFDKVAAQQELSLETVNGQVVVVLPKDAGVQLHSSVVNGRVTSDFPFESGGKTKGKNLSGKIGDGRAQLNVESVNGSIRIQSE